MGGSIAHAHDVLVSLAAAGKFNPVKDYIQREAWDDNDHIEHLASFVKDRDNLFGLALRRWLLGAIDRVYRPGSQNRMLVLVGAQGLGKSGLTSFLANDLDPRYTVQAGIRPDERDDQIRLSETFIWEVTELGATTRRADVEALKAFLSVTRVNVRRPYAKYSTDAGAITSFVGTLNDSHAGFLSDPTGERRFVVCELERIDWTYAQRVNVAQVWAQAKALYDQGERGQFTAAELARVNTVNARFYTEGLAHSGLDMMIELDPEGFVPTDAIVRELKKRMYSGTDDKLAKDVADFMTRKIAAGAAITKKRQRVLVAGQKDSKPLMGWAGIRLIEQNTVGPFTYAAEVRAEVTPADLDRLGGVL
jgi:predicted P-loop ATPase